MEKLDLKKQYKDLYMPSVKKVSVVDVPALQFVMIDGKIEAGQMPGDSPSYQAALEALYGISYTLKFMSKLRQQEPIDYTVMTLEGLWWVEEGEFDITRADNWLWTAMIMQPRHITYAMYEDGLAELREKKPALNTEKMRFETFHEGLSLQIMHIGPYAEEPATLEKIAMYAKANGYQYCGKHHEIYLGDPRRADPSKLKTVLRQPVNKP